LLPESRSRRRGRDRVGQTRAPDEPTTEAEVNALVGELVAAGLVTVRTDAEGRET
jgi:hypothetical protein